MKQINSRPQCRKDAFIGILGHFESEAARIIDAAAEHHLYVEAVAVRNLFRVVLHLASYGGSDFSAGVVLDVVLRSDLFDLASDGALRDELAGLLVPHPTNARKEKA